MVFASFYLFFKSNLVPEGDITAKNKGPIWSYNFPRDFKIVIGFCVSLLEMVEPELDFWGCQKQKKMVASTNFGSLFPFLLEVKWGSENLT